MKKFKLRNYGITQTNYSANILDIWYQNKKIVAYVEGTKIYKTELIISTNRIENYYCSCPSCQGGMHFCKHLAGVENYLKTHEIPELEHTKEKEEELDFNLSPKEILTKFKAKINNFLDEEGCINCYQSPIFSDFVFKYCIYIDNYLDKQEPTKALYLAINFIYIINKIYIYIEDDSYEIKEILINYIVTLATTHNLYDKIKTYLLKKYQDKELDEIGEEILSKIIPTITNEHLAKDYISLLKQIKTDSYYQNKIEEYLNQLKSIT